MIFEVALFEICCHRVRARGHGEPAGEYLRGLRQPILTSTLHHGRISGDLVAMSAFPCLRFIDTGNEVALSWSHLLPHRRKHVERFLRLSAIKDLEVETTSRSVPVDSKQRRRA